MQKYLNLQNDKKTNNVIKIRLKEEISKEVKLENKTKTNFRSHLKNGRLHNNN